MESSKKSYLQILKSTSLLGGVQVLNMIVGVLRTKLSALLIGVDGLGIVALFNSIIDLLRPVFNLSMNMSAVKEVSASAVSGSAHKLNQTIQSTFILLLLLGGVGAAFLLLFAELFCMRTFGSLEYLVEVRCLSTLLITTALFNGFLIVFQGLRHIRLLALCNAGSGLLGLLVMTPIYYFMGSDGIALYLVVNGVIMALFAMLLGRKLKRYFHSRISMGEVWKNGQVMLRMGGLLTVNSLFGAAAQYYLRQHLLDVGGLEVVGLFAASITIIEGYGGILFTAMSGDYYPRLSAIHKDRAATKDLIKQQVEVGILLSTLIVILFITFSPVLIQILFTSEFLSIIPLLVWASISLLLKAIYAPLDYILVIKERYSMVMIIEILSTIYLLLGVCLGYHFGGMKGIGIGYLITSLLNWIQIELLINHLYQLSIRKLAIKLLVRACLLLAVVLLPVALYGHNWVTYAVGGAALVAQLIYICKTLSERTDTPLISFLKATIKFFHLSK